MLPSSLHDLSFHVIPVAWLDLALCLSCRIWVSYLNPIFWTVYGLIESQVDNLDVLVTLNSGVSQPAYEAVETIFGYQ
jgi:hypothetical protein